jgi:hypothetical protein
VNGCGVSPVSGCGFGCLVFGSLGQRRSCLGSEFCAGARLGSRDWAHLPVLQHDNRVVHFISLLGLRIAVYAQVEGFSACGGFGLGVELALLVHSFCSAHGGRDGGQRKEVENHTSVWKEKGLQVCTLRRSSSWMHRLH